MVIMIIMGWQGGVGSSMGERTNGGVASSSLDTLPLTRVSLIEYLYELRLVLSALHVLCHLILPITLWRSLSLL